MALEPDPNKTQVLLAENDPPLAEQWSQALAERGCQVTVAGNLEEALTVVEQVYFDLVFLAEDHDPERRDEFIVHLLELFPDSLVVVMAPQPSVAGAVRAVRLGAWDYLASPRNPQEVLDALDRALEYCDWRQEAYQRRRELSQKYDVHNIVGKSGPMQKVFRLIHKVAGTDATALILGESGTGKELVARAIHHHSDRNARPLVPVNCGAIPGELLESELFGHEKGAFTGAIKTRLGRFELAEGGTVFLDEIGDMSPLLQVKLLRVLQEHQFERIGGGKVINADIRVIAATNQDLEAKVSDGSFREDLFYRLNVVPVSIPPLRERRSDIPLLCQHFLKRFALQKGLGEKSIHKSVMDRLLRYHWPGNVRELENLLERMVILADGDELLPEDLPVHLAGPLAEGPTPLEEPPPAAETGLPEEGLDFNAAVDAFERKLIMDALERTGWIKNQAASLLHLNRTTLVEKIKKKGLAQP
ncbi:Fis family transcriptional regulator [Desulfocarbo indianensis]|nr:Fis family transcriptional regulator [Desulfocarbo indianensis]